MSRKLPAFQFYPGDWLKDPRLRICTHAAKGVYIDMLCLMFECDERGILATSGRAWSDEDIARAVGGDWNVTLSCIRELVERGVVSRSETGALYSRRMVRDECKRRLCGEAGKRGGGNPSLTFKGHPKGIPKGSAKGDIKGDGGSSSSSSSSSSINSPSGELEGVQGEGTSLRKRPPESAAFPPELDTPECRDALARWLAHKRDIGKPYKAAASVEQLLRGWSRAGPAAFVEAVNHSIGQNYQGIFAPRQDHGTTRRNHSAATDPTRIRAEHDPFAGLV